MKLLREKSDTGTDPKIPKTTRRHGAWKRMGVALSIVMAGVLAISVSGGSFTLLSAFAAEDNAANPSGGAPAGKTTDSARDVNAVPKDEVVYARLSTAGTVDKVYVVNVLSPTKPGTVTDFGSYTTVQNLTDASGITQNGDAQTLEVGGKSLSYQGDMGAHALPWDISIAYTLDGNQINASDLGGKSGKLAIEITTKRNAKVDPAFFDNYLLQITMPFSSDTTTKVVTEDGQIALAGSNTQVTFMGMPGKESAFHASAQVNNFTMAPISFAGVPFSMGIKPPDTKNLVSGFRQLGDGVGQLKIGADGLASGTQDLASGVGQAASGVSGLASGAGELAGGVGSLALGAQGVADGACGLTKGAAGLSGGLGTLQKNLIAQASETRGTVTDVTGAQLAYEQAAQTHAAAFAMAYHGAKMQGAEDGAAMQAAAAATADQSAAVQDALVKLTTAIGNNGGALGAAGALEGTASGLGSPAEPESLLGGSAALAAGAAELSSGASALATGADQTARGASSFATGTNQAASGAGQLASGAQELATGSSQLATGTKALYTEVQALPERVQQEIDTMMADYDKSNFKPRSFTSAKNTGVTLVQFVLSTDPINAPEPEAKPETAPELTFWDRFLALFGQ
ncbi:MAG: hypothetical protein RR381_04405 [Raoultibacter sp.]